MGRRTAASGSGSPRRLRIEGAELNLIAQINIYHGVYFTNFPSSSPLPPPPFPPGTGTADREELTGIFREPSPERGGGCPVGARPGPPLPSPAGQGGGTLPVQKLTSAEGSQAAARQGKLSSIPHTDAEPPPRPPFLRGSERAPAPRPGRHEAAGSEETGSEETLLPRRTQRCRRRLVLAAAPRRPGGRGWAGDGARRLPQGGANPPQPSARRWRGAGRRPPPGTPRRGGFGALSRGKRSPPRPAAAPGNRTRQGLAPFPPEITGERRRGPPPYPPPPAMGPQRTVLPARDKTATVTIKKKPTAINLPWV